MANKRIKANENIVSHKVKVDDCFWCDRKIKSGDKTEELPEGRGAAHEKCAEQWYAVRVI